MTLIYRSGNAVQKEHLAMKYIVYYSVPLQATYLCYYTPIFQVACQLSLYFLLVPYNVSPSAGGDGAERRAGHGREDA